ncbi:hypothetical protein DK880_00104 [Candidatus Cardinium hertigii]|uniref:Uncharacterized protein n=1 Tax=Candidatus Cardinium hertigii TaxID=247481 RepID=A0A2Z3L7K9_9BACT|nr:hypothetical protein DK880_00104 [Candidatus Cardinium hertigii]
MEITIPLHPIDYFIYRISIEKQILIGLSPAKRNNRYVPLQN